MKLLISYNSKDYEIANTIKQLFEGLNFSVWIDTHQIREGDDIGYRISRAILKVDAVIPIISPNSIKSHWVEWEIDFCLSREYFEKLRLLFPILISGINLPKRLKTHNYIDFRSWDLIEDNFPKLVAILLNSNPAYTTKFYGNPYFINFDEIRITPKKDDGILTYRSPLAGTYYSKESTRSLPLINEGERVELGQVLCIIHTMNYFNKIEAENSGIVLKKLVQNGTPVYDYQPLFLIKYR